MALSVIMNMLGVDFGVALWCDVAVTATGLLLDWLHSIVAVDWMHFQRNLVERGSAA